MEILFTVLGILLGLILLYLIVIIFFPVLKVDRQDIAISDRTLPAPQCRESLTFTVNGMKLSGWFYKADGKGARPCLIMSHGFGGTKDMALEKYALKYVESGCSVLLYDYRYFGESEGEPRQIYSALYQIEDLEGAIKYARSRTDVDANKIILWGTSAGANYGIIVASRDQSIAGIIAQCGSFDHKEDSKRYLEQEGIGFFMKLMMHGQRDKGRSRFGLSPHTFPAYGKPGTTAMLTSPEALEGMARLAKDSTTFRNEMCARLALMPHAEDPLKLAHKVKCKVQIFVCQHDTLVSPKSYVKLVENLGSKAEVISYPIGHFELYFDEHFEKAIEEQIRFVSSC